MVNLAHDLHKSASLNASESTRADATIPDTFLAIPFGLVGAECAAFWTNDGFPLQSSGMSDEQLSNMSFLTKNNTGSPLAKAKKSVECVFKIFSTLTPISFSSALAKLDVL